MCYGGELGAKIRAVFHSAVQGKIFLHFFKNELFSKMRYTVGKRQKYPEISAFDRLKRPRKTGSDISGYP